MKTFRCSFEENYMAYEEPCNNKRGFCIKYQYIGPWYVYKVEKKEKQRCKVRLVLLCVLSTVCFALAALQKSELNTWQLPAFFSGLSLAAFLYEWYGVIKFVLSGDKIKNQNFDELNRILKAAPSINAFLLFCAAVTCVFLMLRNDFPAGVMISLFYFLSGASSFLITLLYRTLPFEKQENNAWKDDSKKYIRM